MARLQCDTPLVLFCFVSLWSEPLRLWVGMGWNHLFWLSLDHTFAVVSSSLDGERERERSKSFWILRWSNKQRLVLVGCLSSVQGCNLNSPPTKPTILIWYQQHPKDHNTQSWPRNIYIFNILQVGFFFFFEFFGGSYRVLISISKRMCWSGRLSKNW